jgi:hypothetical protein
MNRPLVILIPYFGRWPEWINLFVESCKWNVDVRWRIYTDCGEPENRAENVDFVHLCFGDYKALVRERLGIKFDPRDPYKLCDLRPCLGHIHQRDVAGYRFFGYGDIDVIYGDVRKFYNDEVLRENSVLSTHPERLSGHLAVFRNTTVFRRAYERIPNYRGLLEQPHNFSLDEDAFTAVFRPPGSEVQSNRPNVAHFDPGGRRLLFIERYSTILSPRGWHDGTMNYPQRWFWQQGKLTNDHDGQREFLYLHFMRWQSARWKNDPPAPGEAAWLQLKQIVNVDWRVAAASGFCVSRDGFTPLSSPQKG